MKFLSVGCKHFRNLEDTLISTDSTQVVLVGKNGQGKTNFLEALYTLCYGSSFRSSQSSVMCKHSFSSFYLSAVVETDEHIQSTLFINYSPKKREIRIDGKEIKDRKELIYNIPCIVFSHDDIEFIRGTPEHRRRFFDQTMSMYDPLFFDDLRSYRAVLKQRNAALKEQYYALLSMYNIKLAEIGLRIQTQRKKMVEEFNNIFPSLYNTVSLSSSNLHISYKPSWKNCDSVEQIIAKLEEYQDRDIRMNTTVSGIHRDKFIMIENLVDFSDSGSTGQMRLASLIFRIAQMHTYKNKTGKKPILLIDDVLLELDIEKRGRFLKELDGYSQAFFTFLPKEQYFSNLTPEDSLVYRIEDGRCEKI
ncbi:MAG: DNA replication/repair protein RecF [Spirochaetia bacterium]|nr:DNA replication/repair protein RecF [Spirochaetia bacterium]